MARRAEVAVSSLRRGSGEMDEIRVGPFRGLIKPSKRGSRPRIVSALCTPRKFESKMPLNRSAVWVFWVASAAVAGSKARGHLIHAAATSHQEVLERPFPKCYLSCCLFKRHLPLGLSTRRRYNEVFSLPSLKDTRGRMTRVFSSRPF
jgi:hypothetical protein